MAETEPRPGEPVPPDDARDPPPEELYLIPADPDDPDAGSYLVSLEKRGGIPKDWWPPLIVLPIVLLVMLGYGIHQANKADVPDTTLSSVPLNVEHRVIDAQGRKIDLGYLVETDTWIVISDEDTLLDPGPRTPAMHGHVLHTSEELAHFARLAIKHKLPLTITGRPLQREYRGKQVLLAKKLVYEDETIVLTD